MPIINTHTPSPWEYRGRRISGLHGNIICEIERKNSCCASNAALILAAPKMLLALQSLKFDWSQGYGASLVTEKIIDEALSIANTLP